VTPPFLGTDATVAKLEINGIPVTSATQPNPAPTQVMWPGPGTGRNAFTLTVPGVPTPYEVLPPRGTSPQSQWAFFRLIEQQARASQSPGGITFTFYAGQKEAPFTFATGANPSTNPLRLPALTEFKCPAQL
jgi:type VI protein secretion system component VasK